ncbi:MAG TPA: transposase [Verrucomicrobiae bacterium]|nr:transposase [Verrucomicrobiae bacterium]
MIKVRTAGTVGNRPAYLALGVDLEGRKQMLGVWLGDGGEGAKFWLTVLTELRARGAQDVLLCCCDGLKGLPESIEATWPQASVPTCVVHLIRASLRYCSWKDRKQVARDLTPIYTAINQEAPKRPWTPSSVSTATTTPPSSPSGAAPGSGSPPSWPTQR